METIYFASMTASKDISKNRIKGMIQLKNLNLLDIPEYYDNKYKLNKYNDLYHKLKPHKFELEKDNYIGSYYSFLNSPLYNGKFQFDLWNVKADNYDWNNLRNEIKLYGVRNSLLTALMPTASTSQILGNNECFEFFTSNIYTRRTLAGDFPIINKHMVNDLLSIGEWNYQVKQNIIANNGSISMLNNIPNQLKKLYKIIWEIKQIWVLKNALARAPFVDQTQSMNMFMVVPDFKKLYSAHFWSWKNGLKTGIYYLRTKPAKSALKITVAPILNEICESCSS